MKRPLPHPLCAAVPQVDGGGPAAAAAALRVTVLQAARESRHVVKARCSCPATGSQVYVMLSSRWCRSAELDTAVGSVLTLQRWRTCEVPGLHLPLLLCLEATEG